MKLELDRREGLLILCMIQQDLVRFLNIMKDKEVPTIEDVQDAYAFVTMANPLLAKIIESAEDLLVKGTAQELLEKIQKHISIQEVSPSEEHPPGITLVRTTER